MIYDTHRARRRRRSSVPPAQSWRRLASVAAVALLVAAGSARAQGGRATDNVLYPQPDPVPLLIGPEVGYGWWDNKGGFTVSDGNMACTALRDGKGKGITAGAKAFIYLNSWFFISPRLRYEARSGSFKTSLQGEPVRNAADSVVTLNEEGIVDATFAAATLDGTIGVEFFQTGIYLFGGGSASLLLDGYYDYSTHVLSPGEFTYNDTRSGQHTLVSGRSFTGYKSTAFDLRAGLGYIFRVDRLAFNPEVFYSSPLTSALEAPDELKQTGIIATFSIMYNIGK
jgi:hypothetical protein